MRCSWLQVPAGTEKEPLCRGDFSPLLLPPPQSGIRPTEKADSDPAPGEGLEEVTVLQVCPSQPHPPALDHEIEELQRKKHGPELGIHKHQCWAGTGSKEEENRGHQSLSPLQYIPMICAERHTPGGESEFRIRGITLSGGAGSSAMMAEGAWVKEVSDLGISIKWLPVIRKTGDEDQAAAGRTNSAPVSAGPFPRASPLLPEVRTGKQSVKVN